MLTLKTMDLGTIMLNLLDSILFSEQELWRKDYWCAPVKFRVFVTDPYYLNLSPLSDKQHEAIIALIGDDPLKVFDSKRKKNVAVYLFGKGSGKDFMVSILQCYIFYLLLCMKNPHGYFNFPKDMGITLCNIAPSAQQARLIFFKMLTTRLKNFKWLSDNFRVLEKGRIIRDPKNPRMEIRIKDASVETENNIMNLSLHSDSGNYEGYSILFWTMDEASEFDSKFESVMDGDEMIDVGKAQIIYQTLATSAASRNLPWMGVVISFPRRVDDFTMKMYEESQKNPDGMVLGRKGCTWEYNPIYKGQPTFRFEKWDVPIKLKPYFETNEIDARMKYCCEPPITLNRFFYNDERIKSAIDESIQPLIDAQDSILEITDANGKIAKLAVKKIVASRIIDKKKAYAIHVDLSISSDSTALAIGHGEPCEIKSVFTSEDGKQEIKILRTRVVIDQLLSWKPAVKEKVIVSHINVDEIIEQLTGLTGCKYISYDQYQSQYVLEKALRNGIISEKRNIRNSDYVLFRNMLWAGAVSYPNHKDFIFELERMIWDGRRVDHLPIYSKDLCDCVVGVTRAIAEGLAKPQEEMIFSFFGDELFSGIANKEETQRNLGLHLPKDALPGTLQLFEEDGSLKEKTQDFQWFI